MVITRERVSHPDNPQMRERYVWRVTYRDGTFLDEYPEPTKHHSFNDVELNKAHSLEMLPNKWLGVEGPVYTVYVDTSRGMKPMMTRVNAINGDTGEQKRWHVFGTERVIGEEVVWSICYLPDDGSGDVVISDRMLETR